MRNLLLPIAFCGILLGSCTKNEKDFNLNQGSKLKTISTTSDGSLGSSILSFETMEEYESFFNDDDYRAEKMTLSGFQPLSTIINHLENLQNDTTDEAIALFLASPHIADTIYEDFGLLNEVLNTQKIVNLGDYYVRVDLQNDAVYAIEKDEPNAVNTLLTAADYSDAVTKYSTNIDLVPILFKMQLFCNDGYASNHLNMEEFLVYCSSNVRAKFTLKYQTAGVYFQLLAKVKGQKKKLGIWWNDNNSTIGLGDMNMGYTVRCGQSTSYSGPSSSLPAYIERSNGKVILCRPFHSTRALKSYYYGMNFYGCNYTGYYYIQG